MRRLLRPLGCSLVLALLSGCSKNWLDVIVKKRLYQKGYYVHIPSKRYTSPTGYPKPSPYPTQTAHQPAPRPTPTQNPPANSPAQTPTQSPPVATNAPLPTAQSPVPSPMQSPAPNQIPDTTHGGGGGYGGGSGGGYANGTPSPMQPSPPGVGMPSPNPPDTAKSPVAQQPPNYLDSVPPDRTPVVVSEHIPPKPPLITGEPNGYIQAGFINGPQSNGFRTNVSSFVAGGGFRYNMKIKKWDGLAFDLGYRYNRISVNQKQQKRFPLTEDRHTGEHISINNLSGALCQHIKFKKKENVSQKWLDIGAYADWTIGSSDFFTDDLSSNYAVVADNAGSGTRLHDLHYISRFNYGFTARFGWEYYAVFASYRMNDLIDKKFSGGGDFPAIVIGFELHTWD